MTEPEYAEKVEDSLLTRVGRFFIPMCTIEHKTDMVVRVLSGMIVVRAEYVYDRAGVEYMAMCKNFDVVPRGSVAPEYLISVQSMGPLTAFEFIRADDRP